MLLLHQTDVRLESRTGLADVSFLLYKYLGTAGAHRRKPLTPSSTCFFNDLLNTFLFGYHLTVGEASLYPAFDKAGIVE